jgi:hypothetical protein
VSVLTILLRIITVHVNIENVMAQQTIIVPMRVTWANALIRRCIDVMIVTASQIVHRLIIVLIKEAVSQVANEWLVCTVITRRMIIV